MSVQTPDAEDDLFVEVDAGDRLIHLDREEEPLATELAVLAEADAAAVEAPRSGRTYRWMAASYVAADALTAFAAFVIGYVAAPRVEPLAQAEVGVLILGPLACVVLFQISGLYASHRLSPAEELRRLMGAVSFAVMSVALFSFWSSTLISRSWVIISWLSALVLLTLERRLGRFVVHRFRLKGRLAMRCAIVGSNDEAVSLAKALEDPKIGLTSIGMVTAGTRSAERIVPALGPLGDLEEIVRRHSLECLLVASSALTSREMFTVVQAARRGGAEVRVSANIPQILASRLAVQPMGDVMLLSLRPVRMSGTQMVLKRSFDLVVGTAALAVTAPLWCSAALAVRLTSPGPIFFSQPRATREKRTFRMLKFRTMVVDSDRVLRERGIDPSVPFFKLDNDPRITPVGRWLRKLSLDELPQLINVIRGDMSLVGPRPLPIDQVEANKEMLASRHEVRAGITGWWQINGRSTIDPVEAVKMDVFYIENWSLALDLYILGKTFGAVMRRRGAG